MNKDKTFYMGVEMLNDDVRKLSQIIECELSKSDEDPDKYQKIWNATRFLHKTSESLKSRVEEADR